LGPIGVISSCRSIPVPWTSPIPKGSNIYRSSYANGFDPIGVVNHRLDVLWILGPIGDISSCRSIQVLALSPLPKASNLFRLSLANGLDPIVAVYPYTALLRSLGPIGVISSCRSIPVPWTSPIPKGSNIYRSSYANGFDPIGVVNHRLDV